MEIIGNNLLILREALNLTQAELSVCADISRDYISKIESGSRPSVSQNTIRSLAKTLSSTEQWLTKNTGWAFDPPTTHEAIPFIKRQITKFRPDEIIIVTYSEDGLGGLANGFIFVRPMELISMAGSQTRSGYFGRGSMTYRDALEMIKDANIKTGKVELDKKETEFLIYIDLSTLTSRARYHKNLIEKELHDLDPIKYSEEGGEKHCKNLEIDISVDELRLLEKIKKSKIAIQDLMRYIDKNNFNKH